MKIETVGALAMMAVGGTGLVAVVRVADKWLREDAAADVERAATLPEELHTGLAADER